MVAWNITIVYYNLALVKKSENYSSYGMQQQQFSKKEQHASIDPKLKLGIMMKSDKKDII